MALQTYKVQAPDGKVIQLEGPAGASQDEVIAQAQRLYQPKAAEQAQGVAQTLSSAVQNVPSSAASFLSGLGHAIAHPVDTYHAMADVAGGEAEKLLPKQMSDYLNRFEDPAAVKRADDAATAVNQFYKERYGSADGFKKALAKDPVGVAADLSAVLSGGAGLARAGTMLGLQAGKLVVPTAAGVNVGVQGASKGAQVASALQTAAEATNPINLAGKGIKLAGKAAAAVAKNTLGLTTGTGANSVEQAAKSGYAGNQSFLHNLSPKTDQSEVLEAARQNLQDMMAAKSQEYRQNMAAVSGDKTTLSFNAIDAAMNKAQSIGKYKGQTTNPKAAQALQAIQDEVDHWKTLNPSDFHTPEGLDALKRTVGGILEAIPYEQKTARLAAGRVYDAIKTTISQQAPTYAKVMKDYSDASDQITEIQRALSINQRASADTAIRKLQSLMRNNVQTNYGNRLKLASALEAGGRNELLPAIAGQAMNSWMPRGLAGNIEALATLYGAHALNPHFLMALPLQSPRLVGSAAYGAGRMARALTHLGELSPIAAQQATRAALTVIQAENAQRQHKAHLDDLNARLMALEEKLNARQ